MKKVILLCATALAITFVSCGGNKNKANQQPETDSTAAAETAAAALPEDIQKTIANFTDVLNKSLEAKDTKGVISTLANLETIYKNLAASGNVEEATSYGSAIKQLINEHAEAIKNVASGNTTIASLVSGIQNLPTTAATTAEEAKSAVATDVVNLASPTIAKGQTAVATAEAAAEAIKNAPETVTSAAKTIANSAAEGAKTAVENKVNEKVTSAQEKTNEAVNNAAKKTNEAVNNATNKALKDLGL